MIQRIWRGLVLAGLVCLLLIGFNSTDLAAIPNRSTLSRDTPSPPISQGCGGRTANPRGDLNAEIPYLLSPRSSMLLNDRPTFRWNDITADRYTVSLQNGDAVVWTREASAPELPYPADEPPLESGIDYVLAVEGNGRSLSEEELTTFSLLSAAEAQSVRATVSLLEAQPTTDDLILAQAALYAGSDLRDAAIDLLEAHIATGTESPAIYQRLGDLYSQVNLLLLAEANYLQGVELASNLPERAQLQLSLGSLYQRIGDDRESARWLTEAQQSYQELGNALKVKEIEAQISNPTASLNS